MMKLFNKVITGAVLMSLAFTGSACTPEEIDSILSGSETASPESQKVDQGNDYFKVVGKAKVEHSPKAGEVSYCPTDELDRPKCSYGSLTFQVRADAKKRGRADITSDPVGWPKVNDKVVIPALAGVPGSKDYRGYFYNRSHLLADSLGGSAEPVNMVPGTRTQNVGSVKNSGGMAYTEKMAREYLDSDVAKECPLYYSAKTRYNGDEMIPRMVVVDIQSCDKSIDERVEVFNTANDFTINYNTGEYAKK